MTDSHSPPPRHAVPRLVFVLPVAFVAASVAIGGIVPEGPLLPLVVMPLGWIAILVTMTVCELMRDAEGTGSMPGLLHREYAALRQIVEQTARANRTDFFSGPKQLAAALLLTTVAFALGKLYPLEFHVFSLHLILLTAGWLTGTGALIFHRLLVGAAGPSAPPAPMTPEH